MTAMPVNVDLTAYHGDTWAQPFVLKDDTNTPHNLTGATAACWARDRRKSGHFALVAQVTNAVGGEVTIRMNPGDLATGSYDYDVEITEANGDVRTWVQGRLKVEEDITHA